MLRDIVDESKAIPMRSYFSEGATDLLQSLLTRDPNKRLGNKDDAEEIMMHPFFEDLDWNAIKKREHKMPFKPKVKHSEDTSAIDKLFTKETVKETPVLDDAMNIHQKKAAHFVDFTYDQKMLGAKKK